MELFEKGLSAVWNRLFDDRDSAGLKIGYPLRNGVMSKKQVAVVHQKRPEHIAIIGKTGSGKSSLLKYFMSQDVAADRGFVCIDLHGDLIPFVLSEIGAKEQATRSDLSARLV